MARLTIGVLALIAILHLGAADDERPITYRQLHVDSLVVSRFAVTTVTSVIRNNANESRGLDFQVQLPENAFVSNFTMIVNDKVFHGVAKEKEAAATEFDQRQDAGQNVGLVESRGTELFSVRTNTAANSEARFVLQYEELIVRRRSKYQQVLNLNPGAVVDDLRVEVRVVDLQGVIEETASQFVTTERVSQSEVVFSYSPSVQQQQEDSPHGLARDLTVEYDVVHSSDGGAGKFVVDSNCYFAQFFSPSGVAAVPVDLVFVIDVSGSMSGTKIAQTREALETIINQLRSGDRFTMLTFSDSVSHWQEKLVNVSEYRQQGVQFARGLQADGGTNFNQGLLDGASVLKTHGMSEHVPLLVILTDGQPTSGVTDENAIVENAVNALSGTAISLNCLGFGFDLNFNLLERLALKNNGIVRRIYEGEDAPQQLEGFFEEISSPILKNIEMNYSAPFEVITDTSFPILFNGSEIVVAGKFNCSLNDRDAVLVIVNGTGTTDVVFQSEVTLQENVTLSAIAPNVERLAAYLIVKQLLAKLPLTDIEEEADAIEQQALKFALNYNFVTDLTSLIVFEDGVENGTGRQLGDPQPEDTFAPNGRIGHFYAYAPTFSPFTLSPSPPTPISSGLYVRRVQDSPILTAVARRRRRGTYMTVYFEIPSNTEANCTLRRGKNLVHFTNCNSGYFHRRVDHSGNRRLFGNYTLTIDARNTTGATLTHVTALPDYFYRPGYCYGHLINEIPSNVSTGISFRMYGMYEYLSCRLMRTDGGATSQDRYEPCSSPFYVPPSNGPGSYILIVKPKYTRCNGKRNLKIYFQIDS